MHKILDKIRHSFQLKVLIPVVAVMMLLMACTLFVVNRHITGQLHTTAMEQLDTAGRVFRKTLETRSRELISQYRSVLNEPRIRAITRQADFATLKDSLNNEIMQEAVADNQADIAVFTFLKDGERQQLCNNPDANLATSLFLQHSLANINRAARGQIAADTISVGANILQIVSLPVGSDVEPAGVLTFGVKMDSAVAQEIHQLTQSEVVFICEDKVAASSLSIPDSTHILLNAFKKQTEDNSRRSGNDGGEMVLDHEHFLVQAENFSQAKGSPRTGYLLLSSYEKPLQHLAEMQNMLLLLGSIGVISGVLVLWFVIRKTTSPLSELRNSAEAVGNDDFSRHVETTSVDEVGQLAASFNQMVINVKTSREKLEQTVDTLKATQHQLVQSEKLAGIGEFVAGVAHELNNPLTSVMGFSELLQQGELPEQQRRYLDVISKSAKRCQKIVQSLLSFARRHAPERKVVCANELVESAVEIMSYQMRTSNIEVYTHLDPHLPPTELDPHQMQQVFLNLVNNARQAMEAHRAGGCLNIYTESSDSRVRIIFKDNGPGITPENLKKIFNPFFTTKAVGKGTGLGLSLCYGIVTEHGGTITPSSAPGEGATFTIELPVSKEQVSKIETGISTKSALESLEGVGKRVLVIDDEDSILQMIKEVLTHNGYNVDVAMDGETALKRLTQYHYDLTLCDWKMPGLNGQQLYEKLELTRKEMSERFIFITGDVVNEKTQEFLKSRNKQCLSKPFTLVEFSDAINRVSAPRNN